MAPQVMAERSARYQRSLCREWGLPELADQFIAVHGDRVLHGPFAGLRYWRGGDAPVAKLLGAYESEISSWFAQSVAQSPRTFVDIGAADGYYAVGVKVASPATDVVAFEISTTARSELTDLARLNGVSIAIRRGASAPAIRGLHLEGALVLCDIEGTEADLLPPLVPELTRTTVFVELHEHLRPGVTERLTRCFAATHTIEIARALRREPESFTELAIFDAGQSAVALNEHRQPTTMWARFTPHRPS